MLLASDVFHHWKRGQLYCRVSVRLHFLAVIAVPSYGEDFRTPRDVEYWGRW
jgi:hypothetical protein